MDRITFEYFLLRLRCMDNKVHCKSQPCHITRELLVEVPVLDHLAGLSPTYQDRIDVHSPLEFVGEDLAHIAMEDEESFRALLEGRPGLGVVLVGQLQGERKVRNQTHPPCLDRSILESGSLCRGLKGVDSLFGLKAVQDNDQLALARFDSPGVDRHPPREILHDIGPCDRASPLVE
jgi:hypothetical protein